MMNGDSRWKEIVTIWPCIFNIQKSW